MEGASSRGLSGSSSAYAPPGSADDRNRRCEHVVDLPTRGSDIQRATAGRKHAIFSNGGDAVHAARPKLSEDTKSNDRVKAYVRTRATQRFASHLISVSNGLGREQVSVLKPRDRDTAHFLRNETIEHTFKYDGVLHNKSQEEVYNMVCRGVVAKVLNGMNGSVMCYGQAGSGKTYTACGPMDSFDTRGLIPRALSQVFGEKYDVPENEFKFQVSYLEIYNESVHDLLSGLPSVTSSEAVQPPLKKLFVTEDNYGIVTTKGLTLQHVSSVDDALNCLFEGEVYRAKSHHHLNPNSSRSHVVFTIYVQRRSLVDTDRKDWTFSRLDIVDLAGSERISKNTANGKLEQEAMSINRSLTFLQQAINGLVTGANGRHIPFRQSKLPHILKHCLCGDSNTVMLANIRGEEEHIEDTMSTLRFVERAVQIPVCAKPKYHDNAEAVVAKQKMEIELLRDELAAQSVIAGNPDTKFFALTDVEVERIREKVKDYLETGDHRILKVESLRQVREIYQQFRLLYREQAEEFNEKLQAAAEHVGLPPIISAAPVVQDGAVASVAEKSGAKSNVKQPATTTDTKAGKLGSKKSFKAVASGMKGKKSDAAAAVAAPVLKEEPVEKTVGDLDPSRDGIVIRGKKSQAPAEVDQAFAAKLHADNKASRKLPAGADVKGAAQQQRDPSNLEAIPIGGEGISKASSMQNVGSTTALSSTAIPDSSEASLTGTTSEGSIKKSRTTVLGFLPADSAQPPSKDEAFNWYKSNNKTGIELNDGFVEAKKALRETALSVRSSALALTRFKDAIDEIGQWLQEGNVKSALEAATGVPEIQRIPNLSKRMRGGQVQELLQEINAVYKENLVKVAKYHGDLNAMKQAVQESRRKLLCSFDTLYANSFDPNSRSIGIDTSVSSGKFQVMDNHGPLTQANPSRTSLAAMAIPEQDEVGDDIIEDLTEVDGVSGGSYGDMARPGGQDGFSLNTLPGHMPAERVSLHTELAGMEPDPREQERIAFNNARIRAMKRENEAKARTGRKPGAIVKSSRLPTSTLRTL